MNERVSRRGVLTLTVSMGLLVSHVAAEPNHSLVCKVDLLGGGNGVAVSPQNDQACVAQHTGLIGYGMLDIHDPNRECDPNSLFQLPIGYGPHSVAWSKDATKVFLADVGSGEDQSHTVYVLDPCSTDANNVVLDTITVGNGPSFLAQSPVDDTIFTTCVGDDTLWGFDSRSHSVTVPNVAVGRAPRDLGMSPDGMFIYIAARDDEALSIVDMSLAPPQVYKTVSLGEAPFGVAVSPDGSRVYVTNWDGDNIWVLDGDPNVHDLIPSEEIQIAGGSQLTDAAMSPRGEWLYVAVRGAGSLAIIDPTTGNVEQTITLGGEPSRIAVSPDCSRVYVGGGAGDYLAIVDTGVEPLLRLKALITAHPEWGVLEVEPNLPYWFNPYFSYHEPNEVVTLTAHVSEAGKYWSGWQGDVPAGSEFDNPVTIVMDSDKEITTAFKCGMGTGPFLPMTLAFLGLFAVVHRRRS